MNTDKIVRMFDDAKLAAEFTALYDALMQLASKDVWNVFEEDLKKVLPEDLYSVWHIYIRDFATGDFDLEKIADINDRFEAVASIEDISLKMASGEELYPEEKSYYDEYKDVSVSAEEQGLYNEYMECIIKDSEDRVGKGPGAYEMVIRAKRLCKLMSLIAPEIVIENEAKYLAKAMALHLAGKHLAFAEDEE